MDLKKIGSFLKKIRQEKNLRRSRQQKFSEYQGGQFHAGKRERICRI